MDLINELGASIRKRGPSKTLKGKVIVGCKFQLLTTKCYVNMVTIM